MNKIATHNSATGERGYGFLSRLVAPFSKCQTKTLIKQYLSGCTYFDIRVKEHNNQLYCAHGLWRSERTLYCLLDELNVMSQGDINISVTYEGECSDTRIRIIAADLAKTFLRLKIVQANVKKPRWRVVETYKAVPVKQGFLPLDGSTWHTLLPIPWLWKKIYHSHTNFSTQHFTMVDFL